MDPTPLTIWTNAKLPPTTLEVLRAGVEPHKLVISDAKASNLSAGALDLQCETADIAFGQPNPDDLLKSKSIRWVQLSSAGYTRFERKDLREAFAQRKAVLTNSSSVFDEPCSNHILAMMLSLSRRLPHAVIEQTKNNWHHEGERLKQRLINGDSVVILGFGAIAQRLVELLAPLRMNITAVRRTPTGKEPVHTIANTDVDTALRAADHVVNILPASDETKNFFDAARIARIKPGAYFYNIGRGDTVDQAALIEALKDGRIASAYLDVMTPEPLPPDHPLWTTPNTFITSHTAGGHNTEFDRVVRSFLDNLERFNDGERLQDIVYPK